MRRNRVVLLISLLVWSCATPQRALSTKEIVDRWAAALGGRDAFARVRNTYTRAAYAGTEGEGIVEEWQTATGMRKQRNQVGGSDRTLVFDGRRGWTNDGGPVRPMGTVELEVARTPSYLGSFSHFLSGRMRGSINSLGLDDEKRHYVLRIQPDGGRASTMYLHRATFLPARHVQSLAAAELTIDFEGWREVDGIRIAEKLHLSAAEGRYRATETLLEARTNIALEESAFGRPADTERTARLLTGSPAIFPFEEDQGHVFVRGSLNGSEPLWMGVDTGASRSVVDSGTAKRLGIASGADTVVGGAGGTAAGSVVSGLTLTLPGVEIEKLHIDATDLSFLTARLGRPLAMIVGYELFSQFVVEMNFDRNELRVYDPDTYKPPLSAEEVPIEIEANQPYVRTTVTVGDASIEGRYILDTGSANSVIFTPDTVKRHRIVERFSRTLQSRAGGVGGEMTLVLGRVGSVTFGSHVIANVVALAPNSGEFAAAGAAGNLGGNIFRRFNFVVDYRHQRLLLTPSRHYALPEEVDMSGMTLVVDVPETFTSLRVSRVRDASPAAESGVAVNDLLVSIDGRAVADLGVAQIRAIFRIPDRHYSLLTRRGDEVRVVQLRTRRLL